MRNAFIQTITELARKDKRIFLITGDLGYNVLEDFIQKLPNQFLNAGVSEQNMTGVATGLALSGKIVFTYSIANFPTIRALEQVRNDICYHSANVKIIAVGTGFTYGPLASTHHGTEDLAIMRSLPNMTAVAPADAMEAKALAKAVVKRDGPCYIRISKSGTVYQKEPELKIGKAITVKEGNGITLIAIGSMVSDALQAARELEEKHIHARVLSMHTLKPLDTAAVKKAAKETRGIITVEEHTIIGGLGGAVAEVLTEEGLCVPFYRIGVPDTFSEYIGDQDYLKEKYGLTAKNIIKQALLMTVKV
ncbi:MAG: transketolase [Candidatus Portnoybacteria bacterium]|nr:transketolase [Candidatus Portnoybacteria bacterium]